jgi:cytochrome P450
MRTAPSVPGLPFLGNAPSFLRNPLGFLCDVRAQYGDVARVALGPLTTTLISDPDLVEDILVTRSKAFLKDQFLRTQLTPILGQGLLSSEGDFWRRQRRLAQPAFHRDRIATYGGIMVDVAARLASQWRDGEERDVHKDMMRITLEIVAQTLFGANVGDHAEVVGHALEAITAFVADPVEIFFPIARRVRLPRRRAFELAVEKLDAIIYGFIERRRASGEKTDDLLSMLLHARDEDGSRMSDTQLRDECMTLFLAGHETTAIALSWTWYLLSQHPDVDAHLARELGAVLGDRPATVADVPKLTYASHVIAETLRLYPPAWSMGREAKDDMEIGGFHVPRGENVWFCPWAIHRDPRWFVDRPDTFRPERWEGDYAKTLHRYAYFPFGGGPRFCIGQAFAQMEAVLLLATLARNFKLRVLPRPRVVPMPSVTLRPRNGVHVRVERRRR